MIAVRHMLVPVDGSECSTAALRYAVHLAVALGAEVSLVHAWTPPPPMGPMLNQFTRVDKRDGQRKPLGAFALRDGETVMKKSVAVLRSAGIQPRAQHLRPGPAAEVVLDVIAQEQPDMLIVGTHGRTGLRYIVLGSVAAKLVRLSGIPVLTVPPPDSRWARLKEGVRHVLLGATGNAEVETGRPSAEP